MPEKPAVDIIRVIRAVIYDWIPIASSKAYIAYRGLYVGAEIYESHKVDAYVYPDYVCFSGWSHVDQFEHFNVNLYFADPEFIRKITYLRLMGHFKRYEEADNNEEFRKQMAHLDKYGSLSNYKSPGEKP